MTASLPELQRAFAAGVFEDSDALLPLLRAGAFPAARHFQIYRHNTFANLTDALAACYPVVLRLVGEGFFGFLADRYIRHHPPRSGNLHDFGAALPEFIAGFEPARGLPYLADVARLEWAWQESYHAADAAPLTPESLAAVAASDYPRLRFMLHPSARLVESRYPCLRIWQVNQADYTGEQTVDLDAGGDYLLVIRRRIEVEIATLDAGAHALLRAFAAGDTLAQAATAASAAAADFDLGTTLRHHVAAGTLIDVALLSSATES